jgi:excisionase family DNA binding protein
VSPQVPANSFHLLTVEQAAERLAVSVSTVRRLVRSKQLASVSFGRACRIPSTAIEQFVGDAMRRQGVQS